MNFLAHLFLTKDEPEKVVIGNFIADAVKGNNAIDAYEEGIQRGIRIHREIDDFTDRHLLFKKGTKRLHANYGKFSGIIMDICYDHILASNWENYSHQALQDFADIQYELIDRHIDVLPIRTRMWFGHMKENNLLFNYAFEEEIEIVLQRMDKRMRSISGMGTAINEIREHKEAFTKEFYIFFEEMRGHLSKMF